MTGATARSVSVKGMLKLRTGRTFSIMPQSKSHTSPRLRTMLILLETGGHLVPRPRDFLVVQWPRVEGWQAPQNLFGDELLFLGGQRLVSCDYVGRCCAHELNLTVNGAFFTENMRAGGWRRQERHRMRVVIGAGPANGRSAGDSRSGRRKRFGASRCRK